MILITIPANRASELNQNQIRHQKRGRQTTLGWTSLRRPVLTGWQRGPYTLKCKSTAYYVGYIVAGSFARKQGKAQDTCWKCKGKTEKHKRRKAEKKIVYRDKLHCGMDTVEGTLIVRTVVKWFSGLAKGGREREPYGSSGRKHNLSDEKPRITKVRWPCEDRDQWNRWWEVGIEPKNTTQN